MFLSGAAGLAWQMLWTAQLAAGMGHEIVAVLAVLAAFFGGLALGAQALGGVIERSRWPGRWYAGLEALLAVWGWALSAWLPALSRTTSAWIGAEPSTLWHWSVAFGVPLVLLLPATAAMGATLPAIERQLKSTGQWLGALYSANTAGAVGGVLGVVFLCVPLWGLQTTAALAAALNTLCAALAWAMWRRTPASTAQPADAVTARPLSSDTRPPRLGLLLLATGFLGIGHEVLAVRVLSQVTESTIYSYALLLAVYLLGTAGGAALYQRIQRQHSPHTLPRLLGALAGAVLLGGISLWWCDVLAALPARWLGPGAASALAGEVLAAIAAMAAPTLVMGALFTHLCLQAQQRRWPLGRALALNTAGAALAPLLIGVVLIPLLGPRLVLAGLVLGYAGLAAWAAGGASAPWQRPWVWLPAATAGVLAVAGLPLRLVDLPPGGRVISYRDGVMAAVSVVEDAEGIARLRINNRAQEGSSASGAFEIRLAQLPLMLHPAPRRALFLGLGTGYTAQAAALDATLQVDAVELLPEVIAATAFFAPGGPGPRDAAHPVRVIAADARRFVQAGGAPYDVIVADLFHPARSGAGALYTVEQFEAVRQRLAPGGLFCQWLALHQMELGTLRSIVAAFLKVYPQGMAVLASNSLDTPVIGLIARPGQAPLALDAVRASMTHGAPALRRLRAAARLDDDYAVPGSIMAGPAALQRFAGNTRANSDDWPGVVYSAPWSTYAPQATPRERLRALLGELQPQAGELLRAQEAAQVDRLQAYWDARRDYLRFGLGVTPQADPAAMLQQLQGPLLELLKRSPDFQPAADPLWALSQATQATAPDRANAVRHALLTLQTQRQPLLTLPGP